MNERANRFSAKQQIKISTHSRSMTQNYDVCLMKSDIFSHATANNTDGFNCFDLYILFTKHDVQIFDIPY